MTPNEDAVDAVTSELRFDIDLLSGRVVAAIDWVKQRKDLRECRIGLFGASTGAAAALVAAAERSRDVAAVVSRGGRPDLARERLAEVKAPTLLIVGANDPEVLALNERAYAQIHARKHLAVVPRASHLFEEAGALERVTLFARRWFEDYLAPPRSRPALRL